MFGLLHDALEDFVVKVFDQEKWLEILEKSQIDLKGASFLIYKSYDDRVTWKLIRATAKVLILDEETVLEAFGNHFFKYLRGQGYDSIMRSLGSNLHDFLVNVTFLHEHLSTVFVGRHTHDFRVTHSTEGTMQLQYHSERKGLGPWVRGIIVAAAFEFFHTEVIVNKLSETEDGSVTFEIINKSVDVNSEAFEHVRTPFTDGSLSTSPGNLLFNVQCLTEYLPFHFVFKRNFQIIEMGKGLRRYVVRDTSVSLVKRNTANKLMFSDMFIIHRPVVELTFDSILAFANHLFILTAREDYSRDRKKDDNKRVDRTYTLSPEKTAKKGARLQLVGQMISLPAFDAILFLGSPKIDEIEQMKALDLTMTDFPVHDPTGSYIMSVSMRTDDKEIVGKINTAANHLKIVEKKLRAEISKNYRILHEIFPAKVSQILCHGIKVDAEHFEEVSCLYSNIANYTELCSSPYMKTIDIIRLLNKLYIQLDNQTDYYRTYKLETVGDAYIVLSGVPELVEDHADRCVEMGLAMVHVTRTILSPTTGQHIEMRIGIHSGPCMAGVVGLSMPRYAVFGLTVTTANQMESTGPPGMVHISEATKKCLKKDKYYFMETNQQFEFPTYIVSKLYEEYHEDHLVVENNLNLAGGLFKSPTSSPVHETKQARQLDRFNVLESTGAIYGNAKKVR